jgi:hypothetical protein
MKIVNRTKNKYQLQEEGEYKERLYKKRISHQWHAVKDQYIKTLFNSVLFCDARILNNFAMKILLFSSMIFLEITKPKEYDPLTDYGSCYQLSGLFI